MTPLQERVYQRVIVEGDCWIWKGATTNGQPVMRFEGKAKYVRRHLAVEKGYPDTKNFRYPARCGNSACVAPDHVKRMTATQFSLYMNKRKTPVTLAIARAKQSLRRRKNCLLTDDQVSYIRANPDKLSDRLMSLKIGCSATLVYDVRHQRCYRDHKAAFNPFTQLIQMAGK